MAPAAAAAACTLNHQFESEGGRAVIVGHSAGVIAGIVGGGLLQFQRPLLLFGRAQVALDGSSVLAPRYLRSRITCTATFENIHRQFQSIIIIESS